MSSILTICLLVFGITYCGLLVGFARFNTPPKDSQPATVIVLGCQLVGDQPSVMLSRRLNSAFDYLQLNPQAVCIVSGGQGKNEEYSEAFVMKNYLVSKGIDETRIYLEDQSANTRENLTFSAQVAEKENLPKNAVISTDGFHQLRAYIYATRYGFSPVNAVSGFTPPGLLPGYTVREFFAIVQALFLQS